MLSGLAALPNEDTVGQAHSLLQTGEAAARAQLSVQPAGGLGREHMGRMQQEWGMLEQRCWGKRWQGWGWHWVKTGKRYEELSGWLGGEEEGEEAGLGLRGGRLGGEF